MIECPEVISPLQMHVAEINKFHGKMNCILDAKRGERERERNLHAAYLRDFQYIRLHSEEFLLLANVDLNWSYLCNVLIIQMPHSPIVFNEKKKKECVQLEI